MRGTKMSLEEWVKREEADWLVQQRNSMTNEPHAAPLSTRECLLVIATLAISSWGLIWGAVWLLSLWL
jgi:hypothetical protein